MNGSIRRSVCNVMCCSGPFYMYIKPQTDPKLVLDVRGADHKPGAKVILFDDKGDLADNQLWYEDERGVIRSKMNNFAIDASGSLVVDDVLRLVHTFRLVSEGTCTLVLSVFHSVVKLTMRANRLQTISSV